MNSDSAPESQFKKGEPAPTPPAPGDNRPPAQKTPRIAPIENPWCWLGAGLICCFAAAPLALEAFSGPATPIVQGLLIVLGLLLIGIGVTIRFNSSAPPFAEVFPGSHSILLPVVIAVQLGGALLVSWSLIAAFIGFDPLLPSRTTIDNPPPLRPGLAIVLWTLIAPMSLIAATQVVDQLRRGKWSLQTESAALLTFASLATFVSGVALAGHAESLSFFLAVVTAFLVAAASFVALPRMLRRVQLSAVILCHFAAISNATMAAPPSPWLMGQMWARFSRPYLEFMYLNNAYHFYAPDPGPASYVWFRVFYQTKEIDPKTGEPKLEGEWIKIPNVDENGSHRNRVALEYQRHLSLTENVVRLDPSPPFFTPAPDGTASPAPFFFSRIWNSPERKALQKNEVLGGPKLEAPFVMEVPFHVALPREAQFQRPAGDSLRLLESYVRHIATTPHSRHPEWPVHSVKVYRATHAIPLWNDFASGYSPHDMELFRPFYLGHYSTDGQLLNPNEPLLYWMLPMVRMQPRRDSPIYAYAIAHAGDPRCVFDPNRRPGERWIEAEGAK